MAILTVGVSGTFATIAAAVAASQNGDVVQVQSGTYTNDFVHITTKITLEGVGGIVHMIATVAPPDGKAIMTIGNDATIESLDFSGAKVADNNGAGIRYEGGNLTLENCSFHDNQNGLLSSSIVGGRLTINNCDFNHNGDGSGQTHNLYVGDVAQLTITNSTFTDAVVGHEIKSRAENTIIENCTIADGLTGDASYSIDLPNGGHALIRDNLIQKGPNAENQTIIHYGGEAIAYAGSQLTITGNTVTNDLSAHQTILLTNQTLITATVTGNTFLGVPIATYAVGPATLTNNQTASGAIPDSTITNLGSTGNTIYVPNGADFTVTLTAPSMAIAGGTGHLVTTGFSHETVVGGTGGLTWNGQDGADQIYTQPGSVNTLNLGGAGSLVESAGTDMIVLGIGNNSIDVSGAAIISGGNGTNKFNVTGSAVINDAGSDFISLGAHGTAAITETGYVALNSNGGTFTLSHLVQGATVADTITISGGAASLMALNTGVAVTMAGGSQGALIALGTGNHQVISAAPDTITASTGTDTVILSGSAQVYGGSGALSVFGRGILGMATVHGGSGITLLDGDTGHMTFQAESGAATVDDRLSRTVVIGGNSLLTVDAVGGQLTIQGGSGGILVNDASGGHTITTAAGATDTLNLLGGSTVASNGTDLVTLGSSDNFTVSATGTATIVGGSGNSRFTLYGNDRLLTRSNGIDRVTVGGSASAQISSISAHDLVEVTGGQFHYMAVDNRGGVITASSVAITGQAELDRSNGSVAHVTTQAGAATQVSTSTALRIDSYGSDTIQATGGFTMAYTHGAANLQFGAGGGGDVNFGMASITGGSGAVNVESWAGSLNYTGGSGSANVAVYSGDLSVTGGSGNITLRGGAAVNFTGGSGTAVISTGSGGSTIVAGSGATTVNAWSGTDVFEFAAGQSHGAMLVNNFDLSTDRIQLDGYAAGSATVSAYSGGTALTLSDGTSVQFAGVSHLPGFS